MGDWTSQNWTKRDGRNNQEQEQEQQEKKVTYKTAAELAVKNNTNQGIGTYSKKAPKREIGRRKKSNWKEESNPIIKI